MQQSIQLLKYRMIIESDFNIAFVPILTLTTITAASEPSEKSHIAASGKKFITLHQSRACKKAIS